MKNPGEAEAVASRIIAQTGTRGILAFYGSMGAGKTTLIKAIAKNLGVTGNTASPTFSLVNEYRTRDGKTIFHFDFYRIKKLEEVYDMGYEEYFFSGNLCLIEWPELVEDLLPEGTRRIRIQIIDNERKITLE